MANIRSASADASDGGKVTYRISELVAASGVTQDMIKYYLREGLLPPAEKKHAKLSVYSEEHLALIELILRFQEQTRLSLLEISEVFATANYNVSSIEIELLSSKYSRTEGENIIPFDDARAKTRRLNLPEEFIERLADLSLVADKGLFGDGEEQVAGLLWAAHDAGMPLTFFQSMQERLVESADMEVKALLAMKCPELNYDEHADHLAGVDRIVNRWMITVKNRYIRSSFQQVLDESEQAVFSILESIYRPSDLFKKRHKVKDTMARLDTKIAGGVLKDEEMESLSFFCFQVGEYQRSIRLAQAILDDKPEDPVGTALASLAYGLGHETDKALEFGQRLFEIDLKHPAVVQAKMLSSMIEIRKLRGVADMSDLMKRAGDLFLTQPLEPAPDQPEAAIVLGQSNVVFPKFSNTRSEALIALKTLLQRLDQNAVVFQKLPDAGLEETRCMVFRICALYYLGMLHDMAGEDAKARPYFEEVVQIDPASNFGEDAYLRLGR